MKLGFTKMQGLGNDFVVFDFTREVYPLSPSQARVISDRHFGVGCDQILIVESSSRRDVDFKYRILNADGSEVGQCGNGARCFALFIRDSGLSDKNPIIVETLAGDMQLKIEEDENSVTVNMGVPQFSPADIPLLEEQQADSYSINKDGDAINFFALSLGNPHAVVKVDCVDHAPVNQIGPMLESHPIFPEHANVGFMQIISRDEIALRVFERGVGETLACGSGACAAVVSGIKNGLLNNTVNVKQTGGSLRINWAGSNSPVQMTGSATTVFRGEIDLDALIPATQ
jgi:diaminopimelate epimerase